MSGVRFPLWPFIVRRLAIIPCSQTALPERSISEKVSLEPGAHWSGRLPFARRVRGSAIASASSAVQGHTRQGNSTWLPLCWGSALLKKGTLFLLNRFQEGRYPMSKDPVQIGNADLSPIQHLWDHLLEQLDPPLRAGFSNRDPLQKGGRILMVKDREDTGGESSRLPSK